MKTKNKGPARTSRVWHVRATFFSYLGLALCLALPSIRVSAEELDKSIKYNIPANIPLEEALIRWGAQSGFQLMFATHAVPQQVTRAVEGMMPARAALAQLLNGSGLSYQVSDDTVTITPTAYTKEGKGEAPDSFRLAQTPQGDPESDSSVDKQKENEPVSQKSPVQLEEIVVTGTHIHNADPVAPVITITHDDIINQGYQTLDQVIEQLPQNFKAGASQSSNPTSDLGNNAAYNYSYASGVNLRGLGANATLVLLNGRRLAPTAFGGVTDISQIPVSIIDRVEILTDGASALYGSDAVAGVVNVITRHDYTGVEVGSRINSIAAGKTPNYGGNVLGGFSWSSGNLLLNYDGEKDNPLQASNRSFTAGLRNPTELLPQNELSSIYSALQEHFTDRLELSGDALLSRRQLNYQDRLNFDADAPLPFNGEGTFDQYSASLQLDYKLSSEWTATLVAQGSKEADTSTYIYPDPGGEIVKYRPLNYQVFSIEPRIDGRLFDTPGGVARLAVGGQFRRETYDYVRTETDSLTGAAPPFITDITNASRHTTSVYGELLLPLVGSGNSIPLVQRLRIDVSGRYDDYSDFGRTLNPKIGIEWLPFTGLALHATYSRSFLVPTLYEVSPSSSLNYADLSTVPDPKSPSGSSLALILDGTNPNLQPETSKNFKLGFAYEPGFADGFKFDTSYFYINFQNQINRLSVDGFGFNALQEEPVLGSLVIRNPSSAQVDQGLYSPPGRAVYYDDVGGCILGTPGCPTVNSASIAAIANVGFENSASVRLGGVDLTANYVGPSTPYGRFRADLDGTYFTTYQQRITPTSSEASPLNTLYNPLRFRAKSNLGWRLGAWGINGRLNYATSYENTNAVNPNCPGGVGCQIASWTTVDLSLAYTRSRDAGSWLDGVRIALDVTNLFNRAPPFVATPAGSFKFPYDPTNADALLRTIDISFTKRWGGAGAR